MDILPQSLMSKPSLRIRQTVAKIDASIYELFIYYGEFEKGKRAHT